MKPYSDFSARRTRQIIADVCALLSIGVFIWLGVIVFQIIDGLSRLAIELQNAGAGFKETMTEVGETLGGIPIIGGGIRVPFDGASGAGGALENAGQSAQATVHQVATSAGLATALLPIAIVLVVWLIPRLRFARRAAAAEALVKAGAPLELLALRALSGRRVTHLLEIDRDAVGAWRRGDARVTRELAALELRAAGVRL